MTQFKVTISENSSEIFLELMKNLKFVKKVEGIDESKSAKKLKNIEHGGESNSTESTDTKLNWKDVQNDFVLD